MALGGCVCVLEEPLKALASLGKAVERLGVLWGAPLDFDFTFTYQNVAERNQQLSEAHVTGNPNLISVASCTDINDLKTPRGIARGPQALSWQTVVAKSMNSRGQGIQERYGSRLSPGPGG